MSTDKIAGCIGRLLIVCGAVSVIGISGRLATAQDDEAAGRRPQGGPASPVSFYRQVRPILQRHCSGCHQPAKSGGKLLLTSFAGLKKGGENGEGFEPGQPEDSIIMIYISGDEPEMPLDSQAPSRHLQASSRRSVGRFRPCWGPRRSPAAPAHPRSASRAAACPASGCIRPKAAGRSGRACIERASLRPPSVIVGHVRCIGISPRPRHQFLSVGERRFSSSNQLRTTTSSLVLHGSLSRLTIRNRDPSGEIS